MQGFLCKQYLYKQHQAETGKESSKSLAIPKGWHLAI